ncbi:unnamed protein product [Brassicogethes aeneus]|nr:unnamed protein product [Brassicogethes aeneus]
MKEYLEELDRQIYLRQRDVLELEAKQTTDRQFYDRVALARTTLEKLENKLEVWMKKFGTTCYENRMLRDRINSLMCERTRFNEVWTKLIRNLTTGKKFMLDLIEQATIAYDQREEWVSKLSMVRKKARNQLLKQLHEMRELERKKDNDTKLKNFILFKNARRLMVDLELREMNKRRRRWANLELKVENYKNVIDQIHEFMNEENDINIVKHYLHIEQENFAMFLQLVDVNKEMERMNEEMFENLVEIDRLRVVHDARQEQQDNRLEELKINVETAQLNTKSSQDEVHKIDAYLQQILNGVFRLFNVLKCDNKPMLALLGKNEKVHYYNILKYLEIMEQVVQEKMLTLNYVERSLLDKKKIKRQQLILREDNLRTTILGITDIVKTNPCPLCFENDIVHDVIDTLQKVMTKQQATEEMERLLSLPDSLERSHNVSHCHLPKSRAIMQKRYQ